MNQKNIKINAMGASTYGWLTRQLFKPEVMSLLSGLIPLLVLSGVLFSVVAKNNEERTSEALSMRAAQVSHEVVTELRHWSSTIAAMSQADVFESGSLLEVEKVLWEFSEAVPAAKGLIYVPIEGEAASAGLQLPAESREDLAIFPRFEAAYAETLRLRQGQVRFYWHFSDRTDPEAETLYLITPVTDDSNEVVLGGLVAQFDFPGLLKRVTTGVLPAGVPSASYMMPEPGFLLGRGEPVQELQGALVRSGLGERLWAGIGEDTFLEFSGSKFLLKSNRVDLGHEFLGNVSFSVLSLAELPPFLTLAFLVVQKYWLIFLVAFALVLLVSAIQHMRAERIIRPMIDGLHRFRNGEFDRLIPDDGLDEHVAEAVHSLNSLATESQNNLRHLQLLLNSLPLPVMVESSGQVRFVNRIFLEDLVAGEACGELPCPLVTALEMIGFSDADISAIVSLPDSAEIQVSLKRDDQELVFDVTTSRVYFGRGQLSERVLAFWDVTEEVAMGRMKSELIATAAHELRTPLSIVLGYAELLGSGRISSDAAKDDAIKAILDRARVLNRLVGDMLDLDRLEAARDLPLHLEEFDIVGLISERSRDWPSLFPEHRLEVVLPEQPATVLMDKDRVIQIISNVGDNAAKFSKPGTLIRFSMEIFDEEYRMTCTDQGLGMTASQIDRIFDKFYRVDNSATAPQGSGIGLALVQGVVASCGGRIDVRSEPGKGTEFSVTMPRRVVLGSPPV